MRIKSVLMTLGLLGQCTLLLGAPESGVFFREDFKQYKNIPATCVRNVGIKTLNDPIWTVIAGARCELTKDSRIFSNPISLRGTDAVQALFKFYLNTKESEFKLEFKTANGEKITTIFSANGVSAKFAKAGINASKKFDAALPVRKWRMAAVTIRSGVLTIDVDKDRAYRKALSVKIPSIKLESANFYGFKEKPFRLTDVLVRKPGSLPTNSIERMLPKCRVSRGGDPGPLKRIVKAADLCGVVVRTGNGLRSINLKLIFAGSTKPVQLSFGAKPETGKRRVTKNGKKVYETYTLIDDAIIEVVEGKRVLLKNYIRPLMKRYRSSYSFTDAYTDIIRDQAMLQKASEHPLKIAFRKNKNATDLYIDGSYVKRYEGTLSKVELELGAGAVLERTFSSEDKFDSARFALLDVGAQQMAKTAFKSTPSIAPGFEKIAGIPMDVVNGDSSADVGLTRQGQGNWGLEVDEYLRRSPFDGLLTEIHFRVPTLPYSRAYVLCAVDPDKSKDPVLTTRLAQYKGAGIGNNTLGDTHTRFPRDGEPLPPNIKKVGAVELNGKTVPLYLAEIALNTGKVIDFAMRTEPKYPDYLDVDFFGKPWKNFEQLDKTSKPDPNSTSAIQIFGVTLEKSPVGMTLRQSQPSNVFHNDEKPETTVVLKSFRPSKGTLSWSILNTDGAKVKSGSKPYSFSKAGETRNVKIDLSVPEFGWYELRFTLKDADGKTLIKHVGSMALLGKDERKAGRESPYGTWWFAGSHLTPSDMDFCGSVMLKAGIRQACWGGKSEAEMSKWKLGKIQMKRMFRRVARRMKNCKDPVSEKAKIYAEVRKKVDAYLKKFPSVTQVMIFHESGPGNAIPAEVVGLKPDLDAKRIETEKNFAYALNFAGEFFRKNYPNLKTIVGNTSSSASCIAAILRHGGNPDYIDYIGIETPSQVIIPEKFQEWGLQGFRMAMETAEKLSGRKIPASGCYEFTYRNDRDMGEKQQAEWYARDVLISLAADFKRIGPGILHDASNSYNNGVWGGSGILRRAPFGYPKLAYVAYAVLTNIFDRVKFKRQIPTGSSTVYAVEFERADGKKAYAFWTARGAVELKVGFAEVANGKIVEMLGKTEKLASKTALVKASTSPTYVLSDNPVETVAIASRSFPKDAMKARHARVAAKLEDAGELAVVADSTLETKMKGHSYQSPIWKEGNVKLATVKDEEKGRCVQITLDKTKKPKLNKYITEYVRLKLKTPALIEGDPAALGLWVKGNSNWGRVMFVVTDAEGEVWRSIGTGGWGCDILDWPGNIAVNFDGWNFIALPIRDTRLFNDHSPGPVMEQWVSDGNGDKKMTLPRKLTGFIVEMNRKPLGLIKWNEVSDGIRIKNVGGVYDN